MITQGKWKIGSTVGGSVCVRETGRCNAEIAIICKDEDKNITEVKANARLIAAAPELLEALESISKMPCLIELLGEREDNCSCASCLAKQAIAKATQS